MKTSAVRALLPEVFRRAAARGGILETYCEVMDHFHAPIQDRLDHLDAAFDPLRCEAQLLELVGAWLGLPSDVGGSTAARRALLLEASVLSRRRGTAWALKRHLELACQTEGFEIVEEPERFHVVIRCPPSVAEKKSLVETIAQREKPAHVTFEVEC